MKFRPKYLFWTSCFAFGQAANYMNPDTALWVKLLITSISLGFAGLVCVMMEFQ